MNNGNFNKNYLAGNKYSNNNIALFSKENILNKESIIKNAKLKLQYNKKVISC